MMHYTENVIKLSGCDNIIIIPMYDAILRLTDSYWLKFKNFKFLNFSSTLHKKLIHLGLNSKHIQYFPSPESDLFKEVSYDSLKGFFWQRTNQITWEHVKKLIAHSEFDTFHVHAAVDPPGYEFIEPTEEEKRKYNITISEWFEKREDYFSATSAANIYFAPRLHEGIGMSFLEAMAQGKCVVAPDNPTMNEYIQHGVTGYLYNPKRPGQIDFTNAAIVGKKASEYIRHGYTLWLNQREEIVEFIEGENIKFRITWKYYFYIMISYFSYKASKMALKKVMLKYLPSFTKLLIKMKMRIAKQ
jgi:glycosyltransferase involved in cell wall biosynthesis